MQLYQLREVPEALLARTRRTKWATSIRAIREKDWTRRWDGSWPFTKRAMESAASFAYTKTGLITLVFPSSSSTHWGRF